MNNKRKKIWLVGNKGMLGKQIEKKLLTDGISFIATDKNTDITNLEEVENFVDDRDFDVVINCAAYTAVDRAEDEEMLAYEINSEGPKNLAIAAKKANAELIHFSTDYVYSGNKAGKYTENDRTDPISVYGQTKLKGEENIQKELDNYYILRLSWLYGVYGNNFVKTMVKLFKNHEEITVVNDQRGSPTYCKALAKNIVKLIKSENKSYGVYNYSDEGDISWYDFALCIKNITKSIDNLDSSVKIKPIPSSEFPQKADRPKNSVMDKSKIKKNLSFKIANWESNLIEYFKEWEKIDYEGI